MKTRPFHAWFPFACLITLLSIASVSPAQTILYWGGGVADISGPAAPAGGAGTWDTTLKNWAVDATGTTYQAWDNNVSSTAVLTGSTAATVNLAASIQLDGILSQTTANAAAYTIAGTTAGLTMEFVGSNPTFDLRVANGAGITFFGANNIKIDSANGLTFLGSQITGKTVLFRNGMDNDVFGDITVQNMAISLENGRMTGVDTFYLAPSRNGVTNLNGPTIGTSMTLGIFTNLSRMGANATIHLRGGALLSDISQANNADNFGTLDFQNASVQINVSGNAGATLTINNALLRGTTGVVLFGNLQNANATLRLGATALTSFTTVDQVLPWAVNLGNAVGANRFVEYNTVANKFALVAGTTGDSDLTTWNDSYSSATDLGFDFGTGGQANFTNTLDGNVILNTLAMGTITGAAGTRELNLGGHKLTLNALAIGGATNITNGSIEGAGGTLYIHLNGSTVSSARLTGTNDVVVSGFAGDSRSTRLSNGVGQDNTYVGTMYIDGPGIRFDGAGTKVTGNLVLRDGSMLVMGNSDQIADTGVVTVSEGALWGFGGSFLSSPVSETIQGLQGSGGVYLGSGANNRSLTVNTNGNDYEFSGTIYGNSNVAASAVTKAGAGTWTMAGDNTYNQKTVISGGTLQLGAGGLTGSIDSTPSISIASGAFLRTERDGVLTLSPSGGLSGDGGLEIANTATGTTILSAANTYAGTTDVTGGTLQVGLAGAGQTGEGNVTVTGATSVLAGTGVVRGAEFNLSSGATIRPGDNGGIGVGVSEAAGRGLLTFQHTSNQTVNINTGTTVEFDVLTPTVFNSTFNGFAVGSPEFKDYLDTITWNSFSGDHDRLEIKGGGSGVFTWDGDAVVKVNLATGFVPQYGQIFKLLRWEGLLGTNPTFTGWDNDTYDLEALTGYPDLRWDFSAFHSNGVLAIVPEPSRFLLIGMGLIGLILRRRRI